MGLCTNDYINRLITLSVITLSGFHCTNIFSHVMTISAWWWRLWHKKLSDDCFCQNDRNQKSRLSNLNRAQKPSTKTEITNINWQKLSWNWPKNKIKMLRLLTSASKRIESPQQFQLEPRCTVIFKFFWGGTWGCEKICERVLYFHVLLHFHHPIFLCLLRGIWGAHPLPHPCVHLWV